MALSDKFKSKPRPDKPKARGYKGWTAELVPSSSHNYWTLYFYSPDGKKYYQRTTVYAKTEADGKRKAKKALKAHVDRLLEEERQAARKTIVL